MTYHQVKNNLPDFITEKVFNKLVSIMNKGGFPSPEIERQSFIFKKVGRKLIIPFETIKVNTEMIISY